MKSKIMIIILTFALIISFIINIVLVSNTKNNKKTEPYKTLSCSRTTENGTQKVKSIYAMEIDNMGEILNQQLTVTITESDDKVYNNNKGKEVFGAEVQYNDAKKQFTVKYDKKPLTDKNNQEIEAWYKDYKKSFEDDGFKCQLN